MTTQQHTPTPSIDKSRHVKCFTHDCTNHTDEGGFVGTFCYPCHHLLTTRNVKAICNAHDALVAALQTVLEEFESRLDYDNQTDQEAAAIDKAAEALKLARCES